MIIVKFLGSILFFGDIKWMYICIYYLLKNLCYVKIGYIDLQRILLYQYLLWNY